MESDQGSAMEEPRGALARFGLSLKRFARMYMNYYVRT